MYDNERKVIIICSILHCLCLQFIFIETGTTIAEYGDSDGTSSPIAEYEEKDSDGTSSPILNKRVLCTIFIFLMVLIFVITGIIGAHYGGFLY